MYVLDASQVSLDFVLVTMELLPRRWYYYWDYYNYYYYYYLLQLSCHSVAVVITLVQTKQIRINIHKRNNTKTQYKQYKTQ